MTKNVEINDKVWRDLVRRIEGIADKHAKVGVVGQAADDDHDGLTNAEIAAVHEFGTEDGHIPERSFLRATFRDQRDKLVAMQVKACKAILAGKMDARRALELIGAWGAGAVKMFITRGANLAPLAPITIKRKGSTRPLVDTGQLVNSITFVVVD